MSCHPFIGYGGIMTEQEEALPTPQPIEFQGRTMMVRFPEPEQILVWRRIMSRLEAGNIRDWSGKEVMDALEKLRSIADSVLLDPSDVDWIDDEMLAGRLRLVGMTDLFLKATDAFSNREQRRASKAPAARRKTAETTPAKKATAKKTAAKKATGRKQS